MIDINTISDLLVNAAWIVPVITGLVQVIKQPNKVNENYLPAISLVIGVLFGGFAIGWTVLGIIGGIIFGLSASGFYDLGKKTIGSN